MPDLLGWRQHGHNYNVPAVLARNDGVPAGADGTRFASKEMETFDEKTVHLGGRSAGRGCGLGGKTAGANAAPGV
jgi:hypothetical protein